MSTFSRAYSERWRELQRNEARVIALRDTPNMGRDIPECITSHSGSQRLCSHPKARAFIRVDPLVAAAHQTPGVELVDMTAAFCGAETCDPVVGNVLVWRDSDHMTASYARTIAPALERVLAPLVELSAPSR